MTAEKVTYFSSSGVYNQAPFFGFPVQESWSTSEKIRVNYTPFGVTLKGRNLKKTGTSEDFRFGFNGMEADDEMKGEGNSYDFGARMLDTRLGRWFCIDFMFKESPSWSAYRAYYDNPIRYSDHDGKFEIDEATAKKYPNLNAYLMTLSKVYMDKPAAFKQAFKQYSELSDEQVKKMLEYKMVKNGTPIKKNQANPRIEIKELADANGETPIEYTIENNQIKSAKAEGKITLDKTIVDAYEKDPKDMSNGLVLESTIFHEGTHYGDALNGVPSQTTVTYDATKKIVVVANQVTSTTKEGGKSFEMKAYGEDINVENAQAREDAAKKRETEIMIQNTSQPSDRLTKENIQRSYNIKPIIIKN